MRWPADSHEAGVFLCGMVYGVVVFWGAAFAVTYVMLGGR
jgi:hypothetical protein